jgi:DNA-binding PadR family transcriptional regulator
MFRYVVLGLLRHGPGHGYALMKDLRRRSGWSANPGNFYRELQRLAAEGLLRVVANPVNADPRRSSYEITAAGEAAFDQWLSEPATAPGLRMDPLAVRVLFLAATDPEAALIVLDQWQQDLWLRGKTVERARDNALRRAPGPDATALDALPLLLGRGMKLNAADLDFLAQLRVALEVRARARHTAGDCARVRDLPAKATKRRA